jgi:hypothetical protein
MQPCLSLYAIALSWSFGVVLSSHGMFEDILLQYDFVDNYYDKYETRGAFKEAKEHKYGTFIIGVLVTSGTLFI